MFLKQEGNVEISKSAFHSSVGIPLAVSLTLA